MLIDEEKVVIFEIEPELFSIGTIAISNEASLLSIGVLEIKINEELESHQRTSDQGAIKVVLSTTKTK